MREALAAGAARLSAAGCESPRLDAEVILGQVLGCDRATLVIRAREPLGAAEAAALGGLLDRRAAREPVAHIIRRRAFRRIELRVDRRVLVPRPETETLVEAALEAPRGARVADVGTGSGAVALALADERPDLAIVATDVDRRALAVARANATRLGLDVELAAGDLLEPVAGRLDAVVSNPPYVADGELLGLPPEVRDHEPRVALAGGPDGLSVIRRLVAAAAARAVPLLALEVGAGQAARAAALVAEAGWAVECRRDLAGTERVVVGRRA